MMFFKSGRKHKKKDSKHGEKTTGVINNTSNSSGAAMEAGVPSGSGATPLLADVTASTHEDVEADSTLYALQNEENSARDVSRKLVSQECSKNPGHRHFVPVHSLESHHMPPPYRQHQWAKFIQLKAMETVRIVVSYTSQHRPDDFGFANLKGTKINRTGSGTAFIAGMDRVEVCDCSQISESHSISGCFKVMTAAHVVFDDEEAQNTLIEFFFDDNEDRSTVVTAMGVRVSHIDEHNNRSVIECRTHDLSLYQRLSTTRKEREQLIRDSLAKQVNHEPMVVLIAHPHGLSKCVSFGKLLKIEEEGDIRRTNNGVDLAGCFLTYDTPTCPGTGGGSVNLIGRGEVCLAFAPHYASKSNGENISGLGWTKCTSALQLRAGGHL